MKKKPMPKSIHVEFKNQRDLRNRQAGDYFTDSYGVLQFEIAKTGNLFYDCAILIHEMAEWMAWRSHGGTEGVMDGFDFAHTELYEPGEDPRCPYHKEHMFAEDVERRVVKACGIKWKDYSRAIDKVCPRRD
jgi:hypothetical protein